MTRAKSEFLIIAHIDHGKSTLADRIIEQTGLLTSRGCAAQVLDNMDLEQEALPSNLRLSAAVCIGPRTGRVYFNLIDTPGHVDFKLRGVQKPCRLRHRMLVVDAAKG